MGCARGERRETLFFCIILYLEKWFCFCYKFGRETSSITHRSYPRFGRITVRCGSRADAGVAEKTQSDGAPRVKGLWCNVSACGAFYLFCCAKDGIFFVECRCFVRLFRIVLLSAVGVVCSLSGKDIDVPVGDFSGTWAVLVVDAFVDLDSARESKRKFSPSLDMVA